MGSHLMAEPKDYVSILWRDRSWISDDPKVFLENLKNRLIEEGAKPGTQEYSDAFMSVMGMHADAAKRGQNIQAGGLTLFPFQGGLAAENYLNKNMTMDQIGKELGLNAINLGIGKDVKGAWRSQAGEVILASDPYARSQTGAREFDKEGRPLYRGGVGTIQNISDSLNTYKLSDFETVPDWVFDVFGPQYNKRIGASGQVEGFQREIPQELIDMGFKPGAKVTPEMIAAYDKYTLSRMSPQVYSEVTGQPYAPGYDLQGNFVGFEGDLGFDETGVSGMSNSMLRTGANLTTNIRNPYAPGSTKYEAFEGRRSAFESLYVEMDKIGLGSLVEDVRGLILQDVPPSQFNVALRETEGFKKRFPAIQTRLKKGLSTLQPGEYVKLEDRYRQILREYGLNQFDTDAYVNQFIENDTSVTELSNRISLAVDRVKNADPAIMEMIKLYYPELTQSDLTAFILDPDNQLSSIERKVSAAEIGLGAMRQGIRAGRDVAQQLAAQGITAAQAQAGYRDIAYALPTAEKLSDIYGSTLDRYGLSEAEQERFNSLASAQRKRERLAKREISEFSGSAGLGRGALADELRGQL